MILSPIILTEAPLVHRDRWAGKLIVGLVAWGILWLYRRFSKRRKQDEP